MAALFLRVIQSTCLGPLQGKRTISGVYNQDIHLNVVVNRFRFGYSTKS